ncbi:MAG: M28 family peptidase [Promethearchaeota archaeon]
MMHWKQYNLKSKLHYIGFIVSFLITCGILILASPKIQNVNVGLDFSGYNAFDHINAQLELNTTHYRIPGSKGSQDCANYFQSEFLKIDSNITRISHNFTINSVNCQNVLFKMNEDSENIVILAAHYDSRARATKDPNPALRSNPIPGANDGASGCAVLLELARALHTRIEDIDCQLWFLFFDAEDQGYDYGGYGMDGWDWCEGSNKFVEDIDLFYDSNEEEFDCIILFDMVGGVNLQFIAEQYSTSSLLDELFEVGRKLGYFSQFPIYRTSKSIIDDHVPFVNIGIPSADLIINFWDNPGWPYHHTVNDDNNSISTNSLEITGKTVEQFLYNNYLNPFNLQYNGSAPWIFDMDALETEIAIFFVVMIIILSIIGSSSHYYKKRKRIS